MEIELKLLVDPADNEALQTHPALQRYAMEKPHRHTLVSTYFDTPDMRLRRADAALRVRQTGQGWVQTLKGGGSSQGGLHQRNEWEQPIDGPSLNIASLRKIIDTGSDWHALLGDETVTTALTPVFTTRFTRQVWNLLLSDGTQVECAHDTGTVETESGNQPINELELELKSGSPDALFEFALTLLDTIPLRIGHASKAERGYALHQQAAYQPVKAENIIMSRKATVEEGFQAVVDSALRHILANEEGLTHAEHNMEGIHQMRVGLRRLSTAFRLFEDAIAVPKELLDEFRWLANQLGHARDWQVLATSTLPGVADAIDTDEGKRELIAAVKDHEEKAHATAVSAVNSPRYTGLILNFVRWMTGQHWRQMQEGAHDHQGVDKPLKKYASRVLGKTRRKLLRRGHGLADADMPAMHKVRIAAKRLRYAAEFFESVYPTRQARRMAKHCARLQDGLGKVNDMVVGRRLLQEVKAESPTLHAASAFAQGYLTAEAQCLSRFPRKPWKRLLKRFSTI